MKRHYELVGGMMFFLIAIIGCSNSSFLEFSNKGTHASHSSVGGGSPSPMGRENVALTKLSRTIRNQISILKKNCEGFISRVAEFNGALGDGMPEPQQDLAALRDVALQAFYSLGVDYRTKKKLLSDRQGEISALEIILDLYTREPSQFWKTLGKEMKKYPPLIGFPTIAQQSYYSRSYPMIIVPGTSVTYMVRPVDQQEVLFRQDSFGAFYEKQIIYNVLNSFRAEKVMVERSLLEGRIQSLKEEVALLDPLPPIEMIIEAYRTFYNLYQQVSLGGGINNTSLRPFLVPEFCTQLAGSN